MQHYCTLRGDPHSGHSQFPLDSLLAFRHNSTCYMSKDSISRSPCLPRAPGPPASCRVPSHLPLTIRHSPLGPIHSPLTPNPSLLTTVFSPSCPGFSSNPCGFNTSIFHPPHGPICAICFHTLMDHPSCNPFGIIRSWKTLGGPGWGVPVPTSRTAVRVGRRPYLICFPAPQVRTTKRGGARSKSIPGAYTSRPPALWRVIHHWPLPRACGKLLLDLRMALR